MEHLEYAVKARVAWCKATNNPLGFASCDEHASRSGHLAFVARCKQGWVGDVPEIPALLADIPRLAAAFSRGARQTNVITRHVLREGRFPHVIQIVRGLDSRLCVEYGDPSGTRRERLASAETYRDAETIFNTFIRDWNQCEAEYVADGLAFHGQYDDD
ncbi:hypothetical protein AB7849_09515 [Rhodanobacter sp. 115]|uniref:hypothetical protein n=1 Tax=Rhodanobacter sp. FW021-MT20 TaxID=1162282 RepID=UPI0034E3EFCE